MTEALYMNDSYLREFNALVNDVIDRKYIILDKSAFFPKGGGVPNDTGKLIRISDGKEFNVIFVMKKDGEISHEVNVEGLKINDKVKGFIDWEKRYMLMRYHTAAHVLSGVFSKELKCLITGNQLEIDKGRIDFDLEDFNKDLIQQYIDYANNIIEKDLQVEIYYLKKEEAIKDHNLFKLAMDFKHDLNELRIVDIKNFDRQADGGCHVKSLKEIGEIELLKIENKGKNNRRVYFKIV